MTDRTRAALEAALQADPDDLPGWHAYADLLTEAGDPRGELVRVQLALEDPALDKAARRALRKQEDDLLDEYGREWVGKSLARAVLGDQQYGLSRQREVAFRRGVFSELRHVLLTAKLADALARSKTVGWLRVLEVTLPQTGVDLGRLADAAFAPRLRRFALGDNQDHLRAPQFRNLTALVAKTARLENLRIRGYREERPAVFALPLPHLAELEVSDAGRVSLSPLDTNPSLGRLRRLSVGFPWVGQPPVVGLRDLAAVCRSPYLRSLAVLEFQQTDAGDAAADELIGSGLLFRLERLSLANAQLTDRGVEAIVGALQSAPHQLRGLDVSRNYVTPMWASALPGVQVVASPPARYPPAPVPGVGDPGGGDLFDPIVE